VFGCLPDCELSELGVIDSLWLLAFGVTVYALSRLWAKWAFNRNQHPVSDLRWHIPRFTYIAFITLMLTSVPLYTFVSADIGYWYSRFFLAPTMMIAYFAWLLVDSTDPRKK